MTEAPYTAAQQAILDGAKARLAAAKAEKPKNHLLYDVASNFLPSTGKLISDTVQPFLHPVDTVKALGSLGRGVINKAVPVSGWEADETSVNAVGKFLVDRYGSLENLEKTLREDPAGLLSDLSAVVTGGATLAARVPGIVGKTASTVAKAAQYVDPLTLGVKGSGAALGKILPPILGVTTGSSAEAIKLAFNAGREGGKRQKAFKETTKADVKTFPESIVEEANAGVRAIKKDAVAKYEKGMKIIRADPVVLSMSDIDKAVSDITSIGSYSGHTGTGPRQVVNEATDVMLGKIQKVVDDWKLLKPAEFHTAGGLDKLKQKIRALADAKDVSTAQGVMVGKVADAVRDSISAQHGYYQEVMRSYGASKDLIKEINETFSLTRTTDEAARNLQQIVSSTGANYPQKAKLIDDLQLQGGVPNLATRLAANELRSIFPRGIRRAGGVLSIGATAPLVAAFGLPAAIAAAPAAVSFSPRASGSLANVAGSTKRFLDKVPAKELGYHLATQLGRISEEVPPPAAAAAPSDPVAAAPSAQGQPAAGAPPTPVTNKPLTAAQQAILDKVNARSVAPGQAVANALSRPPEADKNYVESITNALISLGNADPTSGVPGKRLPPLELTVGPRSQ